MEQQLTKKTFKSVERMKSYLYHSGILNDYEVTDFKTAYLLLSQRIVKNRVGRLSGQYRTILLAINRNSFIARVFYGILKKRKIFGKYMQDIEKYRRLPSKEYI